MMPTPTTIRPTLLVVADDPDALRVIEHNGGLLGFLVERRSASAPLPESFAVVKPDVAILDLPAPDERGLDLLRSIRRAEPTCQIILMTAQPTIDMAIDAVKSGASDYLAKPLEAARLRCALTAVRAVVERRERTRETELERLTRMYSAVSEISQAIVRMPGRDELFHTVCQVLVEHGGFRVASIGWRAPGTDRLATIAQWGDDAGHVQRIDVRSSGGPEGRETDGAGRGGRPYVCNDLRTDADAEPWRAEMLGQGLLAFARFPLRLGGRECGALNVYASDAGLFEDREIALLVDTAAAVSYALDNIERDQQHRQAEAVARSEKLFSDAMIESLPGIVYFYDERGQFLRWNHNFATVSGYSAEDITRMHPLDFFSGDDKRRVQQGIADVFENGQSAVEASLVGKDGRATPYFFTSRRLVADGKACLVGMGVDIAERRLAGDRLAESERQYREVVEHANSIILRWNSEGRVTFLNEFGQRFFGYSAAEILGRHVIGTIVPPVESSGRDLERLMDRIRTDPTAFEQNVNENVRRNGERVLIAWTNRIGRDAAGGVAEILSVGTDITAQKRAEGAMRASEARYRTLFEHAPDGILITDSESRLLDANPSTCQMLGYARDELIGLHASAIVCEAEIPEIPSAVRAISSASSYSREWRLRRKDGSIFSAEVIATTMPDGNLLEMIRDVSERNSAVEALRTAEERMRFALQNAEVGIWDMDHATGVIRWSETLEAQYGVPVGTFGGTFENFVERVHPDDRESVLETIEKARAGGGDFSILNRTIRSDGKIRWLSSTGRILLGEHGEPARSVGISLDVTERRTLEAQYQQAQKMEAIGHLAGGVAHDFNNLLTAILGYCELLLSEVDPADPRHADIGEIHKAGTRAAGLTRQLLAFSRRQIIEPTQLDLNVVVTEVREMLDRLIEENIEVILHLGPTLAPVQADRGQIEQIVMNLAVNARDAMPGGGTLTIETANAELDEHDATTHFSVKPGAYVALTVSDTGTGMTPEVQARLFEPFYTTKEVGKGTGLGLATIHGIVTRSGGSARVISEVGKGSSFTVYLPRADAGEPVETAPLPVVRPRGGGETVLVVDDAAELLELTSRLLERQGYKILAASNANEALQLFEQHEVIDVILTDVVMPGASGPDLISQLIQRRPTLKVIYMSGYTEEAIVHHGVLNPGIAFLHKPFSSDALGQKLREVLSW